MQVAGNALFLWIYSNLRDQGTIVVNHLDFRQPPMNLPTLLVLLLPRSVTPSASISSNSFLTLLLSDTGIFLGA